MNANAIYRLFQEFAAQYNDGPIVSHLFGWTWRSGNVRFLVAGIATALLVSVAAARWRKVRRVGFMFGPRLLE